MRLCMISLDAVSSVDADRLMRLPALSALKNRGVFCDQVQTVYPTITYPIHVSLVTGCYPERHGIAHNQPFQPDTPGKMRAWYWEEGQIRVRTLAQAAREKKMDVASLLWPVSGKSGAIRRNFPEVLPLPGENAALKMLRYASPLWMLSMELQYGRQRKSIQQPDLDDYVVLLAEKLYLSRRPPDLMFLHLVDCDAARHDFGVSSPQAEDAMKRLDSRVGRIVQAVEKAGLKDETCFCIVSDHGQKDVEQTVHLDKVLQKACGARAQHVGMGAYIFTDDLNAARQTLIANRAEWHIAHIYDDAELRALHAPGHVHLAVDAMEGTHYTDTEGHLGDHGFSLREPEARVLFLLSGPGVRQGMRIPRMELVDIAPTLARYLDLSLPGTDGHALNDIFD